MPDAKISSDSTVTPVWADFIPIVQSGANKKSTIASLPISTSTQTALDAKLDDSQLDTDGTLSTNSDSKIASQKATKTYVDTQVAGATIPDATSSVKGKLKLAWDLWGTADSPTVPWLSGKQDTLVSGTNIKTINSTSLLWSGDIVITGSGTPATTVTDETTYGITPAVGTSTNYAREDHTHGSPTTPTKTTVGLGNVDNTSDATKNSATATLTNKTIVSPLGIVEDDIGISSDYKINNPIDALTLNQQINHIWSAGITDGANITNNGNGTVNIDACNVIIRKSVSATITRSGSTATVTTGSAHGFNTGTNVLINGANQTEYNGFFFITVTGANTFTYTVSGTPVTPATGSIFTVSEDSQLMTVEVNGVTNQALTDNTTNYIYVDYNGGSPSLMVTTVEDNIAGLARISVWDVARVGNTLYIIDHRSVNVDNARKADRLHRYVSNFAHSEGGTVLTEVGTRNISVTAGEFYHGVVKIPHPAFDTSASGTFTTLYEASGVYTYTAGQTQISNTQYNNPATGLASITAGNYGVFWVYIMNNDPSSLLVKYGQGDYSTKALARASVEPSLNPVMEGVSSLIGRIIIQQGASTFLDCVSVFTKQFPTTSLSLNALSDVNTPDSPTLGDVVRWNGSSWVNAQPSSVSAGTGVTFYKATPVIKATGTGNAITVATLSQTPVTTTEQTSVSSVSVAGTTIPITARRYDSTIGRTSIPAGAWDFNIYASIDSLSGTTTITEQVYNITPALTGTVTMTGVGTSRTVTASAGTPFATSLIDASATNTTASYIETASGIYQITARTSDTVVTISVPVWYVNDSAVTFYVYKKLFGVTSSDFTQTAVSVISIAPTTQPAFTVATTDKLGTITFFTASTTGRTVNIHYNGTTNNSNMTAPFTVLHNDLPWLQGGSSGQYNHLTNAEYTGTGTGNFVRATSPTLVTPALGTPSSGTLTNCTFPPLNQDTTGKSAKTDALNSATTVVNVSSATAPSAGQVLTATDSTHATWQTPSGGGSQCEPLCDYSGPAIIGVLWTYVFDSSKTGTKYTLTADSIPVWSNLIVELRKNSYTSGNVLSSTLQIATTDTLTNGKKTVSITDSDSYIAGDYIVAYLTSVGSTTPALNPYFTFTVS